MKKSNYIPGIDGMRCIAITLVLIFHMGVDGVISSGFIGVDVFFVISGFVISKSLYTLKRGDLLSNLGRFYRKRVNRIIPPLVICLFVTMLVSTLFIPPVGLSVNNGITGLSAFGGISNYILRMNLNSYWAPHTDFNPFVHTWSLAVEQQFYIIYPVLFFIYVKSRDKDKKLNSGVILLLITMTLSIIYNYILQYNRDFLSSYYLLPGRFWELGAGGLLFISLQERQLRLKNPVIKNLLGFTGLALVVYSSQFISQDSLLWALVPVTGTLLLLVVVSDTAGARTVFNTILESGIFRIIGKISYSLYLWHWPVIVIMRWTVGFETIGHKFIYLVLSFILGITSFIFIEKRMNCIKKKSFTFSVIFLWAILSFFSWVIDQNKYSFSLSVTKNSYIWRPWGRDYTDKEPGENYPELGGKKIFVVGDSHAAAYRLMVNNTAYELGVDTVVYERGGYHVGNLLYPMARLEDEDYYADLIKNIKTEIKEGDILFLASLRMPGISDYFEFPDIEEVLEKHFSDEAVRDRKEALEEISELIKEFESLGVEVLIDAPKPVLKTQPYRCSDWFNRNNPVAGPGIAIDRELLLDIREPMMESLELLLKRHTNLSVWDPFFILCENDGDIDNPLFFDGDHLTGHGNRILAPSFKDKLLEIWNY